MSLIFRFRVTFEDVSDVERIIDVGAKNTFRDFHNTIQEAIGFDKTRTASFYKAMTRGGEMKSFVRILSPVQMLLERVN